MSNSVGLSPAYPISLFDLKCEQWSKLIKGGYVGDYIGDYYNAD